MNINNNNKIKFNTIRDLAYKKIKDLVLNGTLKPGDKIYQQKMADKLGISKIPLIQALALLENEGVLVKIPQKGFHVRIFSKDEIIKIFDIRYIFEEVGVKILINNFKDKDNKILNNYLKEFKKYCQSNNEIKYRLKDIKFHHYLIESTENEIIVKFIDSLNTYLVTFSKGILDLEESYKDHEILINSIINKNIDTTLIILKKHFDNVRNKLLV